MLGHYSEVMYVLLCNHLACMTQNSEFPSLHPCRRCVKSISWSTVTKHSAHHRLHGHDTLDSTSRNNWWIPNPVMYKQHTWLTHRSQPLCMFAHYWIRIEITNSLFPCSIAATLLLVLSTHRSLLLIIKDTRHLSLPKTWKELSGQL